MDTLVTAIDSMIPPAGLPSAYEQYLKKTAVRGESLGISVTAEQYEAIESGTFTDLYLGDFWEINGSKYIIVDFNYFAPNSLAILMDVPSNIMGQSQLYTIFGGESGGYVNSNAYITDIPMFNDIANIAFGAHHIGDIELSLSSEIDDDMNGNVYATFDESTVRCLIPTSGMIAGIFKEGLVSNVRGYNTKFRLFQVAPEMGIINKEGPFWLNDVNTSKKWAWCNPSAKDIGFDSALSSKFIKPVFMLK